MQLTSVELDHLLKVNPTYPNDGDMTETTGNDHTSSIGLPVCIKHAFCMMTTDIICHKNTNKHSKSFLLWDISSALEGPLVALVALSRCLTGQCLLTVGPSLEEVHPCQSRGGSL